MLARDFFVWTVSSTAGLVSVAAYALPIMLVLFVLFPRLPGPLWGLPGANTSGRSGLSDTMSPGDLTDLGLSDEIAFRVEFHERPPGPGQLYWRGPVLCNFNGRTWSGDGVQFRGRIVDTLEYSGDPVSYRVMLEPHGRRWVFALDMPAEWPEGRFYGFEEDLFRDHFSYDGATYHWGMPDQFALAHIVEHELRESPEPVFLMVQSTCIV